MQITITEALAEIKLINRKIAGKWERLEQIAVLPSDKKDPLASEGGSSAVIKQEMQSIHDLYERLVAIRTNVQKANQSNNLAIFGVSMSVAAWLNWRKEVLPNQAKGVTKIIRVVESYRNQRRTSATQPEVVVNVDEVALNKQAEWLMQVEGDLDGKLSLFNATCTIEL